MRRHPVLLRLLLGAALALLPDAVFAVGGGGLIIQNLAYDLILKLSPLILIIGILTVIILGFTLLVSHEDGALGKAKSALIACIIGGMIITVILVISNATPGGFIGIFYTGFNTFNIHGPAMDYNTVLDPTHANAVGGEAEGIASWLATMAAVVGMLIIIIAALRAFLSFGDEASYANVRKAILHIVIGLVVISGAYILRTTFFTVGTPNALMLFIKGKVVIILGFMTLIAVAILIYAGLRMVISFGREEDFTQAKSLMLRVIVGLIIILLSFSLMWIVAAIFS